MKQRIAITVIWLVFFLANMSVVICMFNNEILLDDIDKMEDYISPLVKLYSPYIAGILGFWFLRPFPKPSTEKQIRFRFVLAIALTVVLNLIVFFFTLRYFINASPVLENINLGVKIGGLLSILVGPVNAFYFGMKADAA